MTTQRDKILIANGQGFWGDSILGPVRLVNEGPLDYLTLDYLAEVTMSIMQKLKGRDPSKGYATDFVQMCRRVLPVCHEKGIKIIANAGGVNPIACREALADVIRDLGLNGLKIGIVEGDDILEDLPSLIENGEAFANMDNGEPLKPYLDRVQTANVYIGAEPIVEALQQGADIVITGRATDPSIVLAPMIYEFGWSMEDMDLLAAGTIAGHIVECGAQCTGGNFVHWKEIPDMAKIGYPVIEAKPDGTFAVTKHENTGGRVTVETVTSQLVYEMGDPANYITPDCVADFTSIQLRQSQEDRVEISGIKGKSATDTYKVSIAYSDGFKLVSHLTVAGPDAIEKANLCAQIVFDRVKMDGVDFEEDKKFVEILGTNVCHAGIADAPAEPAEVVLRLGAKSKDRSKLDRLGMEIVPLVTSGPPGVTGFAGGRPKPSEIISYWPALLGKGKIDTKVSVQEVR
ncbi:MAG: acyclic terpene utilization AtuA family protein [Planctomycetota bacterium]